MKNSSTPLRSTIFRLLASATLAAGLLVALPSAASAAPCSFSTPSPLPSVDYLIETAADLEWLHDPAQSAQWGSGITWTQTADIDMGGCEWSQGFGTFAGTYDGGGFEISGVDVTTTNAYGGLFKHVTGTIQNLGFTGNVNSSANDPTANYVGGLVGYLYGGSISDSYATGTVTSTYSEANNSGTGGLVGVARTGATITGSYATGDVTALRNAGGLVGAGAASTPQAVISQSYATGDVTVSFDNAGGFAGRLIQIAVSESFATGNVTANGSTTTWGTVVHVAGFSGVITSSTVTDSYATGGVTGGNEQVGGFGGDFGSGLGNRLERVYSLSLNGITPMASYNTSQTGGFVGYKGVGTIDRAFFNNETSSFGDSDAVGGSTDADVKGRSSAQLQELATYTDGTAGWDWNSGGATTIAEGYDPTYTWGICAAFNDGYPFLTAIYSSDPCSSAPAAAGGAVPDWPVFTFQTPGGGECTDISPQYPRLNTWFTLPDADAPCFIKGSVLTGWSIPGQDWAFAPGRRVWVVDSQTFTSVLEYEWVTIEYDSNIDAKDACVANGEDLPVADRTGITHIPRDVITDQPLWSAPVCSAPAYEFLGWTTDNPYNDPTILPKDGTMPAPAVNSDGDAANVIHLYAMWKYIG